MAEKPTYNDTFIFTLCHLFNHEILIMSIKRLQTIYQYYQVYTIFERNTLEKYIYIYMAGTKTLPTPFFLKKKLKKSGGTSNIKMLITITVLALKMHGKSQLMKFWKHIQIDIYSRKLNVEI